MANRNMENESEKENIKENINEVLKQEILTMVESDQKMRKSHEWDSEIDRKNTERMKEIIKEYGWPGKSLVGDEAVRGAWLIVQHADRDLEFQKEVAKLIEGAADKGEMDKKWLAYLIDRIRVNSGQPQLFGTQFYLNEKGEFGPRPIESPGNIEKRRKEYGFNEKETFEWYKNEMLQRFNEDQKKKKPGREKGD